MLKVGRVMCLSSCLCFEDESTLLREFGLPQRGGDVWSGGERVRFSKNGDQTETGRSLDDAQRSAACMQVCSSGSSREPQASACPYIRH